MTDILAQIRLCGILPCFTGGPADALPSYLSALSRQGFPAVEVDYPSFDWESETLGALLRQTEMNIIVKVRDARQCAQVLNTGARCISLPRADGDQPGLPAAAGASSSAVLLYETEVFVETPTANHTARLMLEQYNDSPCGQAQFSKPVHVTRHRQFVRAGRAETDAAALKQMWAESLAFSLVHIGINAAGTQEAAAIARLYASLLGMPYIPGRDSDYAGTGIEVMKNGGRGTHGHIGIATSDLERGMYFARRSGFSFDPDSRKNDASGRAVLYYLSAELGGFAVHLLQK